MDKLLLRFSMADLAAPECLTHRANSGNFHCYVIFVAIQKKKTTKI